MATSSPLVWRHLLPAAFLYPFEEAGRSVLIGNVRASNTASVNLTQHLGFTETCRIPDAAGPGEALIVFTMRREDCAYLTRKAA
jgi:L-amino acid N-acyltransferase YncA